MACDQERLQEEASGAAASGEEAAPQVCLPARATFIRPPLCVFLPCYNYLRGLNK